MILRAHGIWRGAAALCVLGCCTTGRAAGGAAARAAAEPPPIALQVAVPGSVTRRYGVDALQQVVRSTDGGASWTAVLSAGDAQAPDPATPGACLPGNYERVTFLAIDPNSPRGLYVGTEGLLGDPLDNGCGNAPGGLFFSPTGGAPFRALDRGLPASADARGGGTAFGVRALVFDPRRPGGLYVQTSASFSAALGSAQSVNPTAPGIYRSDDGGSQWDAAYDGIATSACPTGPCRQPGSLAVRPADGALLYAADTGFYRSADRGAHWQRRAALLSGSHTAFLLRLAPSPSAVAYVVTDRAIYRSADGGLGLAQLSGPTLPDPSQVQDLQIRAGNPLQVRYLLRDGRSVTLQDGSLAPAYTMGTATTLPTATRTRPPALPSASPSPTPRPPSRPTAMATPHSSTPSSAATTWPMVGHDPGQSYADGSQPFARAELSRLRLRWRLEGAAPQVSAGGTLYAIAGGDARVLALAGRTGAVRYRYRSTGVLSLAVDGPLVYFNRGIEVRYVDAATAAWQHSAVAARDGLHAAFSAVIPADGVIYTGVGARADGALARHYAFDARTGAQRWGRDGAASSTPCLAGGVLYIGFGAFGKGDSYLVDPSSGATLGALPGLGTAEWHAAGGRVYAGVLLGSNGALRASIRAYDAARRQRWVASDVLFGAAQPDRLYAVAPGAVEARDARDGHRIWRRAVPGLAPGPANAGLAAAGDLLFAQSARGRISILDTRTGAVLGAVAPQRAAAAADHLIVAGGMVYESVRATAAGAPTLLAFGL